MYPPFIHPSYFILLNLQSTCPLRILKHLFGTEKYMFDRVRCCSTEYLLNISNFSIFQYILVLQKFTPAHLLFSVLCENLHLWVTASGIFISEKQKKDRKMDIIKVKPVRLGTHASEKHVLLISLYCEFSF